MWNWLGGLCLTVLVSSAAFAQGGEFPRLDMSIGYANVRMPDRSCCPGRHSGIVVQNGYNLTRWFGLENYLGYYSIKLPATPINPEPRSSTLLVETVGGRFAARNFGRIVPYSAAGLGFAYSTSGIVQQAYVMEMRLAAGVDLFFAQGTAFRIDVSRLALRIGGWEPGTNFSAGILFNLD